MTVPFKKRRIVLPQHLDLTPEPATSSSPATTTAAEIADDSSLSSSSSSKHSSCAEQAVLVDTKLDHIKAMIKAQEILIARTTMQVFETCESQAEAEQAIRSIRDLFTKEAPRDDEHRIETLSHTYVQLRAVPQILQAMNQYKDSLKFVSLGTDVLKVLLFHSPKARKSFLQLGGTRTLMNACQDHWFLPLTKAALGALSNVAPFLTANHGMAIEDCLAFVMKSMRIFDADAEIQRLGTYFCLTLAASTALRMRQSNSAGNTCTPEAIPSSSGMLKRKLETY